jgi:hypothetical protein
MGVSAFALLQQLQWELPVQLHWPPQSTVCVLHYLGFCLPLHVGPLALDSKLCCFVAQGPRPLSKPPVGGVPYINGGRGQLNTTAAFPQLDLWYLSVHHGGPIGPCRAGPDQQQSVGSVLTLSDKWKHARGSWAGAARQLRWAASVRSRSWLCASCWGGTPCDGYLRAASYPTPFLGGNPYCIAQAPCRRPRWAGP